jgi:hypothetical protein
MKKSDERPTKPGFYYVDTSERSEVHSHVVQIREDGKIFAVGVEGPINWPPYMLRNWRPAIDSQCKYEHYIDPLILQICTKLGVGGAAVIMNIENLQADVAKYDQLRKALREALKGNPADPESVAFLQDLKEYL